MQVNGVTAELHARAGLPAHIEPMIRSFPKTMHPMTQLCSAIAALQTGTVQVLECKLAGVWYGLTLMTCIHRVEIREGVCAGCEQESVLAVCL
jgi:hypothetical protein